MCRQQGTGFDLISVTILEVQSLTGDFNSYTGMGNFLIF